MFPLPWFALTDVEFAEAAVLQTLVVQRRDDGLAGTRGGDQKVVVEALEPLGLEVLKHLLLVQEGLELEAGGCPGDGCSAAAVAFQCGVQLSPSRSGS